jgi:hypothetical protein
MSVPLEQQSFWNALVADARRKPLRQVARDYGTTLPELQAALLRADVLGARPTEPTSVQAPGAPAAGSTDKVGAPTGTTRRAGRFPRRADSANGARARIEQVVSLLGTEPDGTVARRAGVARKTIVEYRKANGIPAYKGDAAAGPPNPRRIQQAPADRAADGSAAPATAPLRGSRLDTFADIIGVLPDREVAERAGVSAENVRMYRARRGIAAGWRHAAQLTSTPATAASVPAPRPQPAATFAWRVHVVQPDQERRVYSVVADDLLAAVTHAERVLGVEGWSIEGICRIGEVLRT